MEPGNWSLEEEGEDPSIEYLVRPGFPTWVSPISYLYCNKGKLMFGKLKKKIMVAGDMFV